MDEFKRNRFARDHPDATFPRIEPVPDDKTRALRIRLANAAQFPPEVDNLALTHHLDSLLRPVENSDVQSPHFDLASVLRNLGINPLNEVYINWYRYDRIDMINFEELVQHFLAIWYPSSDDIELFDDSCSWLVGIDHTGRLAAVTFGLGRVG